MSRAYRIKVNETIRKIIHGSDHVGTQLDLLPILSAEEMADILRDHLTQRGFEAQNGEMVRKNGDIEIRVNPQTSEVLVQVACSEELEIQDEHTGMALEENERQAREALRGSLRSKLEKQVEEEEKKMQSELTRRLEASLTDLRTELDQIANQVTAAALKKKASQMGTIKEVSEDPESGSMTIVLEV